MHKAPTRWKVAYYGGWMVALATVTSLVAQWVFVWNPDRRDGSEAFWSLGAVVGVVVGGAVARGTRGSLQTHRVLRWFGRFLFVLGLGAAFVLFLMSDAQRQPGVFLGGLVEYLLAMLGLLLAGVGGCVWLAGASGVRLLPSRAAAEGAPLA